MGQNAHYVDALSLPLLMVWVDVPDRAASHIAITKFYTACLLNLYTNFFSKLSAVSVYAELPGIRASDSPQATIPHSLLTTPL